jgi:16S rRNA processing protein RimM
MTLDKDACYYLGHVSKVRGFKGEIILFLDVDNPSAYRDLKSVLLDMRGSLHPFFITSLNIDDKGFARTKFEGIDTRGAASDISGKELYLPLDRLPDLPDDEYYLHELKGMKVEDAKFGLLGEVENVLDFSHNPLIQILTEQHEILIPLNDGFVKQVDKFAKTVRVTVPEELLGMNKL